jgi:hypothetical protein
VISETGFSVKLIRNILFYAFKKRGVWTRIFLFEGVQVHSDRPTMKKLSIILLSLPLSLSAIWFLARRRSVTRYRWGKGHKPQGSRAYRRELERWYREFLPVLEASCDEDDARFLKWRLTQAYGPIWKPKTPTVDAQAAEGAQK